MASHSVKDFLKKEDDTIQITVRVIYCEVNMHYVGPWEQLRDPDSWVLQISTAIATGIRAEHTRHHITSSRSLLPTPNTGMLSDRRVKWKVNRYKSEISTGYQIVLTFGKQRSRAGGYCSSFTNLISADGSSRALIAKLHIAVLLQYCVRTSIIQQS